MNSSETPTIPLKSKKPIHSKPLILDSNSNPNQLSSKTPEKPAQLNRRARNSGVALSINDIRKVAQSLRKSDHNPCDQPKSARRQIETWPGESPTRKPKKPANAPVKLPEKYEILGQFFDGLHNSIRLLRLKGSMPSFTNISRQIECLTERRFLRSHLAQLKFILHEAIEIKKVLVSDERTSCMKEDLYVSINVDAIENDGKLKSESVHMHLRKIFRARLADFLKSHTEGDEIPEAMLPGSFNRPKLDLHSNMNRILSPSFPVKISSDALNAQQPEGNSFLEEKELLPFNHLNQDLNSNVNRAPNSSLPMEISAEALDKQKPALASHLSQSFCRRFSQKVTRNEEGEITQRLSRGSLQASVLPVPESCLNKNSAEEETSSTAAPSPAKLLSEQTSKEFSPAQLPSCPPATPSQEIDLMNNENSSPLKIANTQSTPAKLVSTPARLMNVTPTMHPPKRCYMSPEDDSTSSPNRLVRRPPRSRSLKFDTPVKNQNIEDEIDDMGGRSVDNDILDLLPENLLQSIREKERKAMEECNPAITQAKRRRQMIASLPKLFNMIHFLFQSIKQSVITKEELIHKIVASHCDIVDRREVEEQLNLLLELVPEWISEKLVYGGDLLLRINKTLTPESIRARLGEAK